MSYKRLFNPTDPNFHDIRFRYLLLVDNLLWVNKVGFSAGCGTWMNAKHFTNLSEARHARDNPEWHNDPDAVRKAEIVRLLISVTPELME